ncbi:cupin-like domain-containing protein [Rudaea sp.]|uniref:cupin-like domain-containing protein n=1 Tax=Rudaea sp. TaxID=2136325 RepID=UPI00321FC7C2
MASAIEEFAAPGRGFAREDLIGRERPLVIRGLARDWPLVRARLADAEFVARLAAFDSGTPVDALVMPPDEDGVIGYNANFDGFNYERHRVSIGKGLQRLLDLARHERVPGIAMQSAVIAKCLPGFLAEHTLPFLDAGVEPRIWIGNRVTTPAHFDEYHNIACVLHGRRRFTLFAPEQVGNLYIGPLEFAPTGAAIGMARLDRPDDPRWPRLKAALAAAQVAELDAGDAIYIPPMWWHHVESLEKLNALVNYWWKFVRSDGYAPPTALGCLMHDILAFKSLPPAEKRAWRTLLDHYVFGADDPAEHIPAERRGMLGALTPEQVAKLRETIRRYV